MSDTKLWQGQSKTEAVWHGTDAQAKHSAICRARSIGGYVILSKPPEAEPDQSRFGYWSDPTLFLRNWETQVWPTS